MGLSGQKPNGIPRKQYPVAVERFVNEDVRTLQRFAKKLGAEIDFEDETGIDLREHSGTTWGRVASDPQCV
jgi:hypothetical protein